jgi:hypothetical protein
MAKKISQSLFTDPLFQIIRESFESVGGAFLDRGTSLFETLATIDAAQASQTIVEGGTSIAAHAFHVKFYLNVHEKFVKGEQLGRIDWRASWTLRTVNDSEWESLKVGLREAYEHIMGLYRKQDDWNSEHYIESALAVVAHTAYHLGAIRQMMLATGT